MESITKVILYMHIKMKKSNDIKVFLIRVSYFSCLLNDKNYNRNKVVNYTECNKFIKVNDNMLYLFK